MHFCDKHIKEISLSNMSGTFNLIVWPLAPLGSASCTEGEPENPASLFGVSGVTGRACPFLFYLFYSYRPFHL